MVNPRLSAVNIEWRYTKGSYNYWGNTRLNGNLVQGETRNTHTALPLPQVMAYGIFGEEAINKLTIIGLVVVILNQLMPRLPRLNQVIGLKWR